MVKNKEEYDKFLKSEMFWEFHPELSGDWEQDKLELLITGMKYKHKSSGVTGIVKEDGHLHVEVSDGNMVYHDTIHPMFYKNSLDWEEIIEEETILCYSEVQGEDKFGELGGIVIMKVLKSRLVKDSGLQELTEEIKLELFKELGYEKMGAKIIN